MNYVLGPLFLSERVPFFSQKGSPFRGPNGVSQIIPFPAKVKVVNRGLVRLWHGSTELAPVWPSIAQLVERWTVVVIARHP